jgi:NDP-sugar pyrophosphorylase family protein
MNIIIPLAGRGKRFQEQNYTVPKPLIDVNGRPMIQRAIESLDINGKWHFLVAENEFTNEICDILNKTKPNCNIITIDYVTEGPASSALLFKKFINNNQSLVVANCDQIMEWNGARFIECAKSYHGAVVTYHADTDKNSYAKINERGLVTEIREKSVISNVSLNGIHYWRCGFYFMESAEAMIAANDRAPNGEFYIGPSYNYMIKNGLTVGIYHIPNQQHHAVGVPEDLIKFVEYENTKIK